MSCPNPILIGSCGSAGSTVLSVMLDAHPEILSGPELGLFAHPFVWRESGATWREPLLAHLDEGYEASFRPEWTLENGYCPYTGLVLENTLAWYGQSLDTLRELIRDSDDGRQLADKLFEPLLSGRGKKRWAEKSPQNIYAFGAFLDAYPDGRIVYMVRDPRDTVTSLMRKQWGGFKRSLAFWLVDTAICELYRDHPRVHRIRYEDLVADPTATVGELLAFLDVAPEVEAVLRFSEISSRATAPDASSVGDPAWHYRPSAPLGRDAVGAWRESLTAEQLVCLAASTIVVPVAGLDVAGVSVASLTAQLDYEPFDGVDVDHQVLCMLLDDQRLLLSGSDYPYDDVTSVHESHVECDPEQLPAPALTWVGRRLQTKLLTHVAA